MDKMGWFKRFFRSLPPPKVSQEEAIQVAFAESQRRGWPWLEPVDVDSVRGSWLVTSNVRMTGMNVLIRIDQQTGEITNAAFSPSSSHEID